MCSDEKMMAVLFALMLLPAAVLAEGALPPAPREIVRVYAAPDVQIMKDENGTETVADTQRLNDLEVCPEPEK